MIAPLNLSALIPLEVSHDMHCVAPGDGRELFDKVQTGTSFPSGLNHEPHPAVRQPRAATARFMVSRSLPIMYWEA